LRQAFVQPELCLGSRGVTTGLILILRPNQHCRRFPHKEDLDGTIIDQQCYSPSSSKNLADNPQVESGVYEALASMAEEMLERTDYR
jgi:hypothetical protein